MNNLGMLYRYEMKKIVKRKLVWVTFIICMAGIGVAVLAQLLGSYYVDGKLVDSHYHMFQVDRGYEQALSGRTIDQQLLEETVAAYGRIPAEEERYTLTEEYQTYARPYSAVFNLIRFWTGMEYDVVRNWTADENVFYEARRDRLEEEWKTYRLSETEKAFWQEKETQIKMPLCYFYHEGYYVSVRRVFQTVGLLMLLFIAISLPGVFADEHTRRTDQLILAGAKGKNLVYYAKLLAGVSFAVIVSLLFAVFTVGLSLSVYGTEGFQTAIQISDGTYSYPLTLGQACLIEYGILIVTSVLAAVFVMILSEALHSNIAALAVSVGMIISGMIITVPDQYRVIAQIWNWLPMIFLEPWKIFDIRTLPIFGRCLVSWQIVPVLYLLCSAVIAAVGIRVYRGYQVSGR